MIPFELDLGYSPVTPHSLVSDDMTDVQHVDFEPGLGQPHQLSRSIPVFKKYAQCINVHLFPSPELVDFHERC